jgi:hypothetical protein
MVTKETRFQLHLEGYEYDLSADLLTARVTRDKHPGLGAERANIEVPVSSRLRVLLDATISELRGNLESSGPQEEATEQSRQ